MTDGTRVPLKLFTPSTATTCDNSEKCEGVSVCGDLPGEEGAGDRGRGIQFDSLGQGNAWLQGTLQEDRAGVQVTLPITYHPPNIHRTLLSACVSV